VTGYVRLGGPIACLGLALLLVGTTRRDRIAGLGFAAVGVCVLAVGLDPNRPLEVAVGSLGALAIACVLAVLYRRVPWLMPLAALACVPVRVHALHHQLLVPLSLVVLGLAVQVLWELVEGDVRMRELRGVAWPLAVFVAWTGLSLGWSKDPHEGAIELLAFVIPFALLALGIARLPHSSLGLRALYVELMAMALVFSVVGFYQYETRNIFENPKLVNSNAYARFFRVNSVFWDPSVYGRFLVVALVPTVVLIVRGRSTRVAVVATAATVVIWFGLLISFSQSSFAALAVAVVGLAFVAWRWRALVAVGLAALALGAIAVSQPAVQRSLRHHTSSGLNSASSGRYSLVANGIRIAVAHPATGVGVGGFKRAYAARVQRFHGKKNLKLAASHDTPVTVAAEEGVVGLALFAWLLVGLFREAFRRVDRSVGGRMSLVAGLALSAIFVHSLFYNDFFEDPTTWVLIGLVALAARRGLPAPAKPAGAPVRETVAV
jgi:O-antigen ligase